MQWVLDSGSWCKDLYREKFAGLENLADNLSLSLVNAACRLVLILGNQNIPLGMSEVYETS